MAKSSNDETATPSSVAPSPVVLTLVDFCTRLSETVRRPELIGGFNADQKAAGHHHDTEAAYRARFDAFINKPI